ncbi:hypothetical protein HPB51_005344 [Rhipicephalus microplus]|uniref:TGF-beta family profile domain-containing protein n=1 Tax=Rhipicephalus microplus TaxID=6941 RepID=A0A9J6EYV3_RHIMP|nr:hypothetical protein HPB51_005344 [Rhipicephalus microplus]
MACGATCDPAPFEARDGGGCWRESGDEGIRVVASQVGRKRAHQLMVGDVTRRDANLALHRQRQGRGRLRSPPELGLMSEWQAVHFRFSEAALNLHVSKAHLWVFVSSNQSLSSTAAVWVTLYQVARDAAAVPELHLVKVRTKEEKGNLRRGFWVQMDAKKLVSHWFRHPRDNLGIVVHAYDSEGRKVHAITEPPPGRESLRPFLVVMVDKNGRSRTRRMVGLNCQENSSEERCCRYPLTVDFEEFGWDWIIAPKRYEANYCSGECPYVFMQKYPHTHVVQQVNLSGSPGPCCAPRKISAISMLYFDDNHNIVYGVLPGMIVDRCGCY